MNQPIPNSETPPTGRYVPYLLAILPAVACIAGFFTLYLALRNPDQAVVVDKVSEIHDASGVHQHVTNSVTPPLR